MKKSLFIFFILITTFVYAQKVPNVEGLTDAQIEIFIKDAEQKGLSEMQVEAMAKANGYTDEDIIKVRERIAKLKSGVKNATSTQNAVVREQLGEISERANVQVNTKQDSTKKIFGHYLFNSKNLDFQPNLRIPTPSNYIIGPDDELSIDITGYAYQHYNLVVSAEGTVKLESLAPIYINGLTIDKAKEKIDQRLRTLFAGLRNGSLNLDLTLGKVRSIKVTVLGEASNPGTYTVSSLSTLFHALYMSGGPSNMGSYRNIQLLRNNKIVQRLDLYEFLLKGTLNGNVNLMDQDVVYIPLADKKVVFEGEVKRPMVFELKASENFKDALAYAGGFTDKSYKTLIHVKRNNDKDREIIDLKMSDFEHFALKDGDNIEVNAILDRFINKVEIQGAVFRPGQFALNSSLQTVSQLIKKAEGLREDAFRNRAILKRERENLDPEYISLDLNEILNGKDVELKREDILIIKSLVELREARKVTITGAVNQGGPFDYVDSMTVNDLVLLAGGYKEGATEKRIEIARRVYNDENNNQTVIILPYEGDKTHKLSSTPIILQPFDQVYIRDLPNYQAQETVSIGGEIYYPGIYVIRNRTERISDLIERAGGLRPDANLKASKFYRDGTQVALDLEEVLKNKGGSTNLYLQTGDKLDFVKEAQTVTISGQVFNPQVVAFQPGFNVKNYLSLAGGFNESAFERKTYVRYQNGFVDHTNAFLGFKKYPKAEKGMNIIVPARKDKERLTKAEVISISTAVVSLSAVLLTVLRLAYIN